MHDPDVRRALRAYLEREHPSRTGVGIVDELAVFGGARLDMATFGDGVHGYEIKSDADTLRRFASQRSAYNRAVTRMTIVIGQRYRTAVRRCIPQWWGILLVGGEGEHLSIAPVREARSNPRVDPAALAKLLWRPEALALLGQLAAARGMRSKTASEMAARLADLLPIEELDRRVAATLKHRGDWRAAARRGSGGVQSRHASMTWGCLARLSALHSER